jgi:hypothetical protein
VTKLDDEIAEFKLLLKGGGKGLIREFNNPFSTSVVMYVKSVCKSPITTYFMLGVAVEALGLSIQFMFTMDTYPVLDFVVAGVIALALYAYQNPGKKDV